MKTIAKFSILVGSLFIILSCNSVKNRGLLSFSVESFSELQDPVLYLSLPDSMYTELINRSGKWKLLMGENPVSCQLARVSGNPSLIVNVPVLPAGISEFSAVEAETADSVLQKRTLAELWHKTGGRFENKKYVDGGPFQPFDSMKVPEECTDHSFYVKYEGPGWESDKVGYRIYLDWRNAVDIFGKTVHDMVLPEVGQDGYDSYHELNSWGMDILKVGNSLGIGSLGYWNGEQAQRVAVTDSLTCKIAVNGDLYSEVNINYYGWKTASDTVDLRTALSIEAGSRATHYTVYVNGEISNLCTGIVKESGIPLLQGDSGMGWAYIATWGLQSLNNDSLGMAILYKKRDLIQQTEDEFSHVVVLKPENQKLDYYLLAAWQLEKDGITNQADFEKYLKKTVSELSNPVQISLRP